jgi:hypothetical protein
MLKSEEEPKIKVIFDNNESCNQPYYLRVSVENKSSRTINNTSFKISVSRAGYSSVLHTIEWQSDKIIKPDDTWNSCSKPSNFDTMGLISIFRGSELPIQAAVSGYTIDNADQKIYEFMGDLKKLDIKIDDVQFIYGD